MGMNNRTVINANISWKGTLTPGDFYTHDANGLKQLVYRDDLVKALKSGVKVFQHVSSGVCREVTLRRDEP